MIANLEQCGGFQNAGMWVVVRQPHARRKVACYDKTARYRFMVVAGALVEISSEFYDKLFIRLLKTEEATASSASMLATPLTMVSTSNDSFLVSRTLIQQGDVPLVVAASNGHTKVVQRLLEAGAKVNHQNKVMAMFYSVCDCDTK